MGFTLPDDFVRAALPLIKQADTLASALSDAQEAAYDAYEADDGPASAEATETLRRAYKAFLNVQWRFDSALRAAGFDYRPGAREAEAMWRQLTLHHGADIYGITWEVPGSPTFAGTGHGRNKSLAFSLGAAGMDLDTVER